MLLCEAEAGFGWFSCDGIILVEECGVGTMFPLGSYGFLVGGSLDVAVRVDV